MQTTHVEASRSITMKPGFIATATEDLQFSAKIVPENNNPFGTDDYQVYGITYDANGNIQALNRNKNTVNGNNEMDKLHYNYYEDYPNRLKQVLDSVTNPTGVNDIKTQVEYNENYIYNAIGQLIENKTENIKYQYNASGLVTKVYYQGQLKVQFIYDDKGKRVQKKSYNNGVLYQTTTYVRDASGNPMAIYEDNVLKELPIYGASRLGIYYKNSETSVYQLTDHLGSVRALISKSGNHAAALVGNTDYYPFGMPMPNRQTRSAYGYRYAYQGQEKDPETGKEAFELRLWDSRIGRWLTTDPKKAGVSPYWGMNNNPISVNDPDGGEGEINDTTIVELQEDGTYKVVGGILDGKTDIITTDGELIGYSVTEYSFYDAENDLWLGNINPNDGTGFNFILDLLVEEPSLIEYMKNATGGGKYDFKRTGGTDEVIFDKKIDWYRGGAFGMVNVGNDKVMPVYASARDIGNIGAGIVAQRVGLTWNTARMGFDALETAQKNILNLYLPRTFWNSEQIGTQAAQYFGFTRFH